MTPDPDLPASIEFGRFTVRPRRRELFADGKPIELGGRAFDVLMTLIGSIGSVLSKDELMSRVWPGRIVEENSLEAQVSALRKALGPDRDLIRTVAGRGYQFTSEIRSAVPAVVASPRLPSTNLPEPVWELIGRDTEMAEVADLAMAHRLITLVGAGGVGKTRLSLEVARQLLSKFADGVWVAELGPLSDPELVPVTVATALGVTLASGAPSPERVASALGAKQVLLVLDNCEHVIEAAARMAEALLQADPLACVLATSREPLRLPGEFVYRVPSLEVPAEGTQDEEDLLRAGAVRMFMVRARAVEPHLSPDRTAAAIIAAICRRLDGIPLAIELAAARAATLGVEGLAVRLDDRFRLLTGGYRTALPRHQTLRATLDWSYKLLPEPERLILRRIAVFAGAFTLESASAVAADSAVTQSDVVERLANLVAKSLVTADLGRATLPYRLLETTRAYALEKLVESGESEELARRHAIYHGGLFERAESEFKTLPADRWVARYGPRIGEVRAALDWAFSPSGDAAIGVALTIACVPLWMRLYLMDECGRRVEQALASINAGVSAGTRREMQLFAALATALLYTSHPGHQRNAACTRALEIAERLDDVDYELRALCRLWLDHTDKREYRIALAIAQRFCRAAARSHDPGDALVGERLTATSLHYLGDQVAARQHIEHMLDFYVAPLDGTDLIRFQFDQQVLAEGTRAQILWLQGLPDQAIRIAGSNVERARTLDHALTLCTALGQAACPVALLNGDLASAESFVEVLLAESAEHALDAWHVWGRCFKGVLLIKRGDLVTGLAGLRHAIAEVPESRLLPRQMALLGELADALASAGEMAEGVALIDDTLARSEQRDERWCIAELLRIKGALVTLQAAPNARATAERYFLQALDWARQQGALSWELRCATSLARLWHEQGQTTQARELLGVVYGRFTEGFETADLKTAKALLGTLR